MFKSIRSATRRIRSRGRADSVIDGKDSRRDGAGNSLGVTGARPTLLGLPGELRNVIYELVATDTNLIIPVFRPRKIKNPPGLLFACKTTAREYKGILLRKASMTARVYEYNFNSVRSVLTRLHAADLCHLLCNGRLKIEIFLATGPTHRHTESLAEWLCFRDRPTELLHFVEFAFTFRFLPDFRPPRALIRYRNGYHMRLELLTAHIDMYRALAETRGEEYDPAGRQPPSHQPESIISSTDADGEPQQLGRRGDIFSMICDAERLAEILQDLANENAVDSNPANGNA